MTMPIREMWCQECGDMQIHHVFSGFVGVWCQCRECSFTFFISEPPQNTDPDDEEDDDADIPT